MVDNDPENYAREYATEFLQYDFNDHTRDDEHATNILDMIKAKKIRLAGVLTFWEDCVPLTAKIRDTIHLRGE